MNAIQVLLKDHEEIRGYFREMEETGRQAKQTKRKVAEKAIRELKDFAGITGTFTFNEIGDPTVAQYFVLQVKSADPAKWGGNEVVETLKLAPPK